MAIQRVETSHQTSAPAADLSDARPDHPVREYIGAMALELAQMARRDGDETLGRLLDSVAALAAERLAYASVEVIEKARRRPA